jgi:hypothetical protein
VSKNALTRTKSTTVNPLVISAQDTQVEPEWGRVEYITKRFQVGRTVVFRNIAKGIWKSVLLRDKHKKSGIRLVYVPSVRDHLKRLLEETGNTGGK